MKERHISQNIPGKLDAQGNGHDSGRRERERDRESRDCFCFYGSASNVNIKWSKCKHQMVKSRDGGGNRWGDRGAT